MHRQWLPGPFFSAYAKEPGDEATYINVRCLLFQLPIIFCAGHSTKTFKIKRHFLPAEFAKVSFFQDIGLHIHRLKEVTPVSFSQDLAFAMGYENENWLTPDMVVQFIIALYYFGVPAMVSVSRSVCSATDIVHTTVGVVRYFHIT